MDESGNVHPILRDRNRSSRSLWVILAILALLAIGLVLTLVRRQNQNRLALGRAGYAGPLRIPISAPTELDFLPKNEVLALRSASATSATELIQGGYEPSIEVFGQIEDHLPWWGFLGYYYFGAGEASIEGLSEESRFILNPYLVVGVDFYHDWRSTPEADLRRPGTLLDCLPQNLIWHPSERWAEVVYDAGCLDRLNSKQFDLISYNARDLNLNYIYVDYEESFNVTKEEPPEEPYKIPQYLHRGNSCGYPGGCNNMSPPTPAIDGLTVQKYPARLVIRLWEDQPSAASDPSDLIYVIRFSF